MVLPSFSLILETENLANANLEDFSQSLSSLVQQSVSPAEADEVLLIESGDVPGEILKQISQTYPWLTIKSAPSGVDYYKVKMLGAELATGEVIVYCDSDCVYEPCWLENMLRAFGRGEVQAVAGETTIKVVGPYTLAMAIVFIFPPFSGEKEPTPTKQYYLNNVAFRREFLLNKCPIPTDLDFYRGNCVIHAYRMRQLGYTLWRHPQSRSTHAPPEDLRHFCQRFFFIGKDYYRQQQMFAGKEKEAMPISGGVESKTEVFKQRVKKLLLERPVNFLYLPLAIPIILLAVIIIAMGYLTAAIRH